VSPLGGLDLQVVPGDGLVLDHHFIFRMGAHPDLFPVDYVLVTRGGTFLHHQLVLLVGYGFVVLLAGDPHGLLLGEL